MLGAVVLFVFFVIIYAAIVEIFTVLFRLTGMTEEKARFQVISMLTNTGYTTSESEVIVGAMRRRKLARVTILFGYSFNVTIVSIIINFFLQINNAELRQLVYIVLMLVALIVFLFFISSFGVKKKFDEIVERVYTMFTANKDANIIVLMDTYGEKVMASITLNSLQEHLDNVMLKSTGLKRNYGVQVLVIRHDNKLTDPVDGESVLNVGDTIVAFGRFEDIKRAFG